MSDFILPVGVPTSIECNEQFGAKRPCDHCGSISFTCEPGKGPHALGLRCSTCGRSYRWLGQAQVEEIKCPSGSFEQYGVRTEFRQAGLGDDQEVPW